MAPPGAERGAIAPAPLLQRARAKLSCHEVLARALTAARIRRAWTLPARGRFGRRDLSADSAGGARLTARRDAGVGACAAGVSRLESQRERVAARSARGRADDVFARLWSVHLDGSDLSLPCGKARAPPG